MTRPATTVVQTTEMVSSLTVEANWSLKLIRCKDNAAGNGNGNGNDISSNGINFKRQTDVLSDALSPLNSDLDSNEASSNGDGNSAGNSDSAGDDSGSNDGNGQ